MRRRWGRTDNVGHGCEGETTTTEGGKGSPGFEYLNPSLFDDGRDGVTPLMSHVLIAI